MGTWKRGNRVTRYLSVQAKQHSYKTDFTFHDVAYLSKKQIENEVMTETDDPHRRFGPSFSCTDGNKLER